MLAALDSHRPLLFGLAYRMTGSASDADDVVQETFARALASPPEDTTRPIRPWLVRVACNLARDRLRARRRNGYDGTWLPEALETGPGTRLAFGDGRDPEARYDERESVTLAFLVALELLPPMQRAVLVLRDVLGFDVDETARCLGRTTTYVKVAHHRARGRIAAYDASRVVLDAGAMARTHDALVGFVTALANDDVDALVRLLRADVVTTNDGGGEFLAARKPVSGRDTTITFHRRIRRPGVDYAFRVGEINGLPALVLRYAPSEPSLATSIVLQVECDAAGLVRAVRSILAPRKLVGVAFPSLA